MKLRKSVGSESEEFSDESGNSSDEVDEEQLSNGNENLEIEESSEELSVDEGSEDNAEDDGEENDDNGMMSSEGGDEDESDEGGSVSNEDDEDEDGDDDDDEEVDGEDDGEDDEEADSEDDEEENAEMDISNDVEVGTGITAQSKLYSGLLACRLKVQEAVTAMNQLPQNEMYNEIVSDGIQFSEAITNTKSLVENTLNELANLQDELLSSRDDTKPIADEKSESAENNGEVETNVRLRVKRKIEDYPNFLTKRQKLLNNYRDSTLKAVSTLPIRSSFANFESSAIVQIQQILLDKERLIKRTQLIRSVFPVIGKKVEQEENDVEKASRKQMYDVEIFDDSDFFNKLVTQFTSLKTANFSDMNAVSKQWAELNKLRKNTAVVDRRASKGRKTRYTVHRKLVNFMTPVEDANVYSDEQRDALAREVFSDQS